MRSPQAFHSQQTTSVVLRQYKVSRHLPHLMTASPSPVHMPCTMQAQEQLGFSVVGSKTITLEARDERDPLFAALSERLEQMEGIWYSDDFYGPHGREWVEVSATLVGAGTSALVAVKVTGDANVPSGYQTWRTTGLPDVGGASIPAEVQIRANINDPNGFSWIPGSLVLVSKDKIVLTAFWSSNAATRGTFHKHKIQEGT